MLDCSEFLEDYSGFRDGILDPARAEAMRRHASACPSCARYDRVVASGVDVFRDLPGVEPSYDFLPRLQHRIYQADYEASRRRRRASGASAVLTAGMGLAIAATVLLPRIRTAPEVVELPPIAAHAPHRVEPIQVLYRTGPLLTGPHGIITSRRASLFDVNAPLGSFASTPLHVP
jgi:hypothetical protein